MSLINYTHNEGEPFVTEHVDTGTQVAEITGHIPYHKLRAETEDGEIAGDGQDTETVTIEVVDGLEIARGSEADPAAVLDYDGDVTLSIDGVETTKALTDGSVSFEVTTEKLAGSTIEIVAESLADHPAESDSATIEVVE